jgi:UDP-N-acetylmuramate dehydrogenase
VSADERWAALDAALSFLGPRLEHDRPLGPLSTYRVGGPARRFLEVADADELVRLARALVEASWTAPEDVLVVGRGSNLLVADRGAEALVLQLGEQFSMIEVHGEVVRAGGATSLPVLARRTVAAGLRGFEWAVGVPGSVGGAVRMNAGGHGDDMAASLLGVRVVDLCTGEDVEVDASALDLGYRRSSLRRSQVVVHAELQLSVGDPAAGDAVLSEIVRWRREHQPGGQNAGSVFTNPAGDSAGRLIDAAGAKGLRVGTASVSDKHANFIQAEPGGSADDVAALMAQVRRRVLEHSGVELHPETVLVGFSPEQLAAAAGPLRPATDGGASA